MDHGASTTSLPDASTTSLPDEVSMSPRSPAAVSFRVPAPRVHFTLPMVGWLALAFALCWMTSAGHWPGEDVNGDRVGLVPFWLLTPLPLAAVQRLRRVEGEALLEKLGIVLLLAWLIVATPEAFVMNWSVDPLLLRMSTVLNNPDHLVMICVIAAFISVGSWAGSSRELPMMGLLAMVAATQPWGVLSLACVWVSVRLVLRTFTWRWFGGVVAVGWLALVPEALEYYSGMGRFWGSWSFELVLEVLLDRKSVV